MAVAKEQGITFKMCERAYQQLERSVFVWMLVYAVLIERVCVCVCCLNALILFVV